jgi:hypothetical protein
MNIRALRICSLKMGPKKQIGDLLLNGSNDFYYILVVYGDHRIEDIFRKVTVLVLGIRMPTVDFIKTVFHCCTVFSIEQ